MDAVCSLLATFSDVVQFTAAYYNSIAMVATDADGTRVSIEYSIAIIRLCDSLCLSAR